MSEATCADAGSAVRIGCDVEDDVVGTRGIARDASDAGEMIESEVVSHAPRDVVVGARSVATDAYATDNHLAGTVERQPTAEDVDPADLVADHRVLRSADLLRRSGVCVRSIHRVTVLQTVQTAAGLHSGIQVRGGEREPVRLARASAEGRRIETECVRGVGLLRRDDSAARPLGSTIYARERDSTHDAITIDDCGPHLVIEAAGLGGGGSYQSSSQGRIVGQPPATVVSISRAERRGCAHQ